ncbi:MAG: SMI1/KNR4 family protein [Armatimonadetes bacterium]|nr:SMI1/KNR4 family protein [Armatimonadota bacterium]
MWKELIQSLTTECEFYPRVTPADIVKAEFLLHIPLPHELKSLLNESNGVHGEYGLGLVWPIERITQDNLEFRRTPSFKELYMPFDSLLFFADAGNGDQFAFIILDGLIRRHDIW